MLLFSAPGSKDEAGKVGTDLRSSCAAFVTINKIVTRCERLQ